MGLCAQAKMLIDRAQQFWSKKYILRQRVHPGGKAAMFISCSATSYPEVFQGALQVMRSFFL